MIITDEDHIIDDCLKKIRPYVDAIAIDFNGKGTTTPSIIKKFCTQHKIPLNLREKKWVDDFGHSRSEALQCAEELITSLLVTGNNTGLKDGAEVKNGVMSITSNGVEIQSRENNKSLFTSFAGIREIKSKVDGPLTEKEWQQYNSLTKDSEPWYIMFHDADNTIECINFDKVKLDLKNDLVEVDMSSGGSIYNYRWMVKFDPSGKNRWKWFLPLHEYVDADGAWNYSRHKTTGVIVISGRTGLRSQQNQVDKYLKDAVVLRKYRNKPENAHNRRALFYEANSWHDAREYDMALKLYMENGKYEDNVVEERYISLYRAGILLKQLRENSGWLAMEYFYRAHQIRPQRLEALYEIVLFHRKMKTYRVGWDLAKPHLGNVSTSEVLWTTQDIYQWRFYEQAAICGFHCGEKLEAQKLFKKALESTLLQGGDRTRIEESLNPLHYS